MVCLFFCSSESFEKFGLPLVIIKLEKKLWAEPPNVDLLRGYKFLCHLLRHARQGGVSVDGTLEDGLRCVV